MGSNKNLMIEEFQESLVEKTCFNRLVVEEDGSLHNKWDPFVLLAIVYTAIFVPYKISFIQDEDTTILLLVVDKMVDAIFVVDLVLAFFTSYYDSETNKIVKDVKLVASHYL